MRMQDDGSLLRGVATSLAHRTLVCISRSRSRRIVRCGLYNEEVTHVARLHAHSGCGTRTALLALHVCQARPSAVLWSYRHVR
jgi:hypothetical protein